MPCSAALRVVRSPARLSLCSARACSALRRTVSARSFLSPRMGTRMRTAEPRMPLSQAVSCSASAGISGTRICRGTTARASDSSRPERRACSASPP